VLLACVAGAPWAGRWLASRPLLWLGKISYSLYLWHLPVIAWVAWQSGELAAGDFWPYFAACLLLVLVVASASWWLVERPAQAWAARR
jgi:peptidoglycan/LPS O-acetylase OafA/YrhL